MKDHIAKVISIDKFTFFIDRYHFQTVLWNPTVHLFHSVYVSEKLPGFSVERKAWAIDQQYHVLCAGQRPSMISIDKRIYMRVLVKKDVG